MKSVTPRSAVFSTGRLFLLLPLPLLLACSDGRDAPLSEPVTPSTALAEHQRGRVTVRLKVDTAGDQLYVTGDATEATGLATMAVALKELHGARPSEDTLFLFTYPGARGFDVIMAFKAARAAGFKEVVGFADYTDDASEESRAKWKRWNKSLAAVDGLESTASDSGVIRPR